MDGYREHCPKCGTKLLPNAAGPETPPWRCDHCRISFWVSEITPSAVVAFRPEQLDHGHGSTASHSEVRQNVADEAALASLRGTSIRHDQLDLIAAETHTAVLKAFAVHPDFAPLMEQRCR